MINIFKEFSIARNYTYALKKVFLFILAFIPGIIVGELILIPWYIIGAFFFLNNKYFELIETYILFVYMRYGFYQYNLLGESLSSPISNYFDKYLLVLLLLSAFLYSKKLTLENRKILGFCIPFFLVAIFSGLINFINPVDLLNYFTSTFRWLILLYILLKLDFRISDYVNLLILIIVIILISSVLGGMQTLILPIKATPDGYIPNILDVASGLFGATASQFLTVLCLSFIAFFIFLYLTYRNYLSLFFITILFIQVFLSSSKSALAIVGGTLSIFLIIFVLFNMKSTLKFSTIVLGTLLFFSIMVGLNYYNEINYKYFGKIDSPIEKFLEKKRTIEDFQKIIGYIEAFNVIAPTGNLGVAFGVGPTNYFSFVGLKKSNKWVVAMGIDKETTEKSSADFKGTDLTGIIGELGLWGIISFFFMIYKFIFYLIKKILKIQGNNFIPFFTLYYLVVLVLYSFYNYGWFYHFLYLPFLVLISMVVKLQTDE